MTASVMPRNERIPKPLQLLGPKVSCACRPEQGDERPESGSHVSDFTGGLPILSVIRFAMREVFQGEFVDREVKRIVFLENPLRDQVVVLIAGNFGAGAEVADFSCNPDVVLAGSFVESQFGFSVSGHDGTFPFQGQEGVHAAPSKPSAIRQPGRACSRSV